MYLSPFMDLISTLIPNSSCIKALLLGNLGYHIKISKFIHSLVHSFFYLFIQQIFIKCFQRNKVKEIGFPYLKEGLAINQCLTCNERGQASVLREHRLRTYWMWTSKMPPGGVALEVSSSRAFWTERATLWKPQSNKSTDWSIQETEICLMSPEQKARRDQEERALVP